MSSPTPDRPTVTIYPSSREDVKTYLKAIRLASSVRNTMNAQKAGADSKGTAIDADSYGRHHPNFPPPPPPPADPATTGGRKAVPTLNQTSSAHFTSNTTSPDSVQARDSYPSPSRSMDTEKTPSSSTLEALNQHHDHLPPPKLPTDAGAGVGLEEAAADAPTGVKLEASEQHHGSFPPPEPPIGATPAPPGKSLSNRTGPIPIDLNPEILHNRLNVPVGSPSQCQLYVTNTVINMTFTVCPVTKRNNNNNNNVTDDLTSRELHSGDASNSHILAIRSTVKCEEPIGFGQRVACGNYDGRFALGFFVLLSLVLFAWIMKGRKHRTQRLDEEGGRARWPGCRRVSSTNSSKAKLMEKMRKAHQEGRHVGEQLGTEEYEPVAWRSASRRAARANVEGRVEHDAGPVAVLPENVLGEAAGYSSNPRPSPLAQWINGMQDS